MRLITHACSASTQMQAASADYQTQNEAQLVLLHGCMEQLLTVPDAVSDAHVQLLKCELAGVCGGAHRGKTQVWCIRVGSGGWEGAVVPVYVMVGGMRQWVCACDMCVRVCARMCAPVKHPHALECVHRADMLAGCRQCLCTFMRAHVTRHTRKVLDQKQVLVNAGSMFTCVCTCKYDWALTVQGSLCAQWGPCEGGSSATPRSWGEVLASHQHLCVRGCRMVLVGRGGEGGR